MTAGALMLSHVHIRRGGRTVLQIEGLEIPAGDFVGIVGANGAGKTTLLSVCAGLIRPDSGEVRHGNNELTRLGAWRKCEIRKHIGYIPQSAEYNAELPFTLREVVAMGRTSIRPLLAVLKAQDYAVVDHWIDVLGLSDRRNQTFRSLSGGEQQKTLVARAMAQDPRILMLDEACANLDFHWKYQISDIVEQLYHQTKMTVLMVSHDTSVLPRACGRVILLSGGRILADGGPQEVLSSDMLRRAYHGSLDSVVVGGRRHITSVRPDSPQKGTS